MSEVDLGPLPPPADQAEPRPTCPDCGSRGGWTRAGLVPGSYQCIGCGELFVVEVRADGHAWLFHKDGPS